MGLQEAGPPLYTHCLSEKRGSPLSHIRSQDHVGEVGTCLPHTLQSPSPPPVLWVRQYSQGFDVLCHHRGVLWVSLWGDQVPSLRLTATPNALGEGVGGRARASDDPMHKGSEPPILRAEQVWAWGPQVWPVYTGPWGWGSLGNWRLHQGALKWSFFFF